jgi:hypothetical protein
MSEKRSGTDRRSIRDRRKGGNSSYSPEKRSLRFRRSDTERRNELYYQIKTNQLISKI